MNEGVKILLARMETHPEEFYTDDPYTVGRGTKWDNIIIRFRMHLNEEDGEALDTGLSKIMQQRFTEKVIGKLLDPHEDAQQEINFKTSGNVKAHIDLVKALQPQILPSSITVTSGGSSLTSEPLVNKKPTTVKVRKPTTTGKLFNYT